MTPIDEVLQQSSADLRRAITTTRPPVSSIRRRYRTRRLSRRIGVTAACVLIAGVVWTIALDSDSDGVDVEVATTPDGDDRLGANEQQDPPSTTQPEASPETIGVVASTAECLGFTDLADPPETSSDERPGFEWIDLYVNPFDNNPTLVVIADLNVVNFDEASEAANACADLHGASIDLGYDSDPGGELDQPIFEGETWHVTAGEAANYPSDIDTYKVCHLVSGVSQDSPSETELETARCRDWPDADLADAYILDAWAAPLTSGPEVLLFLSLGVGQVDRVLVEVSTGERLTLSPFTMPRSGLKFAVLELPAYTTNAFVLVLADDGVVVDEHSVDLS